MHGTPIASRNKYTALREVKEPIKLKVTLLAITCTTMSLYICSVQDFNPEAGSECANDKRKQI